MSANDRARIVALRLASGRMTRPDQPVIDICDRALSGDVSAIDEALDIVEAYDRFAATGEEG